MDGGNGLVLLAEPRERIYIPQYIDSRDLVIRALQNSGRYCGHMACESHRVDLNRDALVNQFLKHPRAPEWFLMLDTDMDHPHGIAERLIAHDKPLIGGLYFYRHDRFQPQAFRFVGPELDTYGRMIHKWHAMDDEIYAWLVANGIPRQDGAMTIDGTDDPLIECDAIGGGTMLIHRSILEPMKPPWFEYPHGWSSEDMEFCKRVGEEQEIKPYVDRSTISGHFRYVACSVAHFMVVHEEIAKNGNPSE